MFQIAICDDCVEVGLSLEGMILQYGEMVQEHFAIQKYTLGETLFEELERGRKFDLIFLDIDFGVGRKSGIEVGNLIREKLKDEYTHIVYVSAREDCFEEAFESRPLHFLRKPFLYEKVRIDIEAAMKRSRRYMASFVYSSGRKKEKIYIKDIAYFESRNHKVIIHMTDCREMSYYDKLQNVVKQVKEYSFLLVHRSYLVQTEQIQCFRGNEVVMENGDVLPISRTQKKIVSQYILHN